LDTYHRVAADPDNRVARQVGVAKDEKTYRALRREGNSGEKSAKLAGALSGH
jgi:hypothetical protein